MRLFESRNDYELLVSMVIALGQNDEATILTPRENMMSWRHLTFKKVNFGEGYLSKARYFFDRPGGVYDHVFAFHEISPWFNVKSISRTLIQHGEIAYLTGSDLARVAGLPYRIYKYINREPFVVGASKKITSIMYRDKSRAPMAVSHKADFLDLNRKFALLDEESKGFINSTFGFKGKRIEGDAESILLTQPFSELGWMTESDKLGIYRDLVDKYHCNLIKPHPTERTCYRSRFPGVDVIDKSVPFELYELNGISFDRVVTIYSSGVEGINCNELVRVGTGLYPTLVEKVGQI